MSLIDKYRIPGCSMQNPVEVINQDLFFIVCKSITSMWKWNTPTLQAMYYFKHRRKTTYISVK
jgi:hypothetical protein